MDNGIKIGTPLKEAKQIDPKFSFDEWNEDWESPSGYWLEDNLDPDKVMSITIFIKEASNDEEFNKYKC